MRITLGILLLCCSALGHAAEKDPATAQGKIDPLRQIEYIVVIYAENRSFDNLYGLFPGADGIAQASAENRTQTDHNGKVLAHLPKVWNDNAGLFKSEIPNGPFRLDAAPFNLGLNVRTPDLVHRYYQQIEQINGGRLDRYAAMSDAGALTMAHYDGAQLPLWKYAKEFVLADHFFMGAFGGSFLNHFWLVCACTPTFTDAPDQLKVQLDENGKLKRRKDSPASALDGPPHLYDNPLTPDGYAVNTLQAPFQPSGLPPAEGGDPRYADPARLPLPPQTFRSIGDTLSARGIRWAWYAEAWQAAEEDGRQPPQAPRTVVYGHQPGKPSLEAHHQPFNYFARFAPGTEARREHLRDGAEFLAAIDAGTLPQVAFYKPGSHHNEHSGYADVLAGDRHIAGLIARLQASRLWPKLAIIVTYDENGGYWDHVAPPSGSGWGDRWGPGARIPALIISPFAKRGFVDSTPYDTTSIIKFITRRFDLEPLPGVRKNAGDLVNAFTFPQK
jgi:phospholipase C